MISAFSSVTRPSVTISSSRGDALDPLGGIGDLRRCGLPDGRRSEVRSVETRFMTARARRAKKRPLRPRTPARVKKRTRRTRSHHHPELWGLGMVAVGLVLATVVDLGWDGGVVGGKIADGLRSGVGDAAYVVPFALVGVGGLMLVRSALVDFRPFQTGLGIASLGLLVA